MNLGKMTKVAEEVELRLIDKIKELAPREQIELLDKLGGKEKCED